jgi:hypothetical protein
MRRTIKTSDFINKSSVDSSNIVLYSKRILNYKLNNLYIFISYIQTQLTPRP